MTLVIVIAAMLWSLSAHAACTGASPTWSSTTDLSSVQTCVTNATAGDTINVASGSATWSGQLAITKGITLVGSSTTITANNGSSFIIEYNPTAPQNDVLFRITGFTFNLNGANSLLHMIEATTTVQYNVRFDHNTVTNAVYGSAVIWHEGSFWGVVDHNTFTGDPYFQNYGAPAGDINWEELTFTPGSRDALYFEDNTIETTTDGTLFSTGNGGRFVFRYNHATIQAGGSFSGLFPFLDAHGNMGPGGNYGTMGAEIYGNLVDGNGTGADVDFFDHRGGKGRVFNNRVIGTGSDGGMQYREEHPDTENPPANNSIDGTPQHVNDAYYWQNRYGSNTAWVYTLSDNSSTTPLTVDVDVFIHTASFNGSSGIGVGTVAAMNAITPSTTGVGFWATNDSATTVPTTLAELKALSGTLYRWNGSAWVLYYTPYTYPHPLVSGAGGGSPSGSHPAGVKKISPMINLRRGS